MNPEYKPERLGDFLSIVLEQEVEVMELVPNDTVRITIESTLLITDIVVKLADGKIVNVEMQKIGYKFPGERTACYGADLLLRQYKQVRGDKETANYKDIKPVYTIVLFEKSPAVFHEFPDHYIHHFEPKSNTGIRLNLLQNYYFIPLDIFAQSMQNKPVTNKKEAWLRFFSSDRPEDVIQLITVCPEFKEMYGEIYQLCLNTERLMNMFSQELYELDKNTVKYMIDEMQDEIDGLQNVLAQKENALAQKENALMQTKNALAQKENALAKKDAENADLLDQVAKLKERLAKYEQ